VTKLLRECADGDTANADRLVPLIYDELRRLASAQISGERAGHTLQPTALVHEAFLALVHETDREWRNRRHFFCAAATAMRRILINHAQSRKALKRGGGWSKVPLDETVGAFEQRAIDLVQLDEALNRLALMDESKARLVELRFFAGLTVDDTADLLGVSTRTVERDWRVTRAWLRKEVGCIDED
jgi:RNA polymerase sigma factor (TIGR02999 family)